MMKPIHPSRGPPFLLLLVLLVAIRNVASFQTTTTTLTQVVAKNNHNRQRHNNNNKESVPLFQPPSFPSTQRERDEPRIFTFLSMATPSSTPEIDNDDNAPQQPPNLGLFFLFASIGIAYWYLLVLGAFFQANGFPVPEFLPLTPGWPVSDQDLAPVLEDSYHFFYLSDLLQNPDAPSVAPPRLAVFNLVEAWIFAMLPLLWRDTSRRLPKPILLVSWLALGINLTNAFLAPYLALTEWRRNKNAATIVATKNPSVSWLFALVASLVVGHALTESLFVATPQEWSDFLTLAQTDRSYLAFCIDPILFALFQPLMLARVKPKQEPIDAIPFVGLIVWLVAGDNQDDDNNDKIVP